MKKLSLLLPLSLAASFAFSASASAEVRTLTLLNTNDIESVYEPVDAFWNDEIDQIGGIPYLTTLIKQVRAEEELSFLFDAGDIYTGSLSKKTKGKLAWDLYSAMGYDAITLGNHEFEYGWKALKETMPRASFPALNSNIIFEGNEAPFAQPYTIVERDGVRIGVVGTMGIDAFYNTMWKGNRKGLTIKDPTETVQYWVDKIHDDVDMVVVLTHQNKTAPMQTDKEADPEVQRGFDEDYAMAGRLKNVDVLFGGHSDHGLWEPVIHPESGTIISLTFGQGKYLGYNRISLDTESGAVKLLEGKLIPVESSKLARDAKTGALIDAARAAYPELAEVIATIDGTAARRYYRESTLGNLVADMMRDAAKADIGMMSSGSIRVDLNQGDVTMENVMNIFPFTDKLAVVSLSGAQLKELLEYSYKLPYGLSQFSGLETTYDSTAAEGQRIRTLTVGGKEVADDAQYTLATYSYVASGGDGYTMLGEGEQVSETEESLTEVLIAQFKAYKDIKVPALGRQVDISRN